MWSDGDYCASYFRSRFVFKLLENYCRDLQLEGNYNEVDHGKSLMDGIREQVECGRVVITSAEEYSVAANQYVP